MSHKQALDAFGQEDLESHVTSGRLSWRESPITKGVWEYMDHHDVGTKKTLSKRKLVTHETHNDKVDPEEGEKFDSLFDDFLSGSANAGSFLDLADMGLWTANSKGESKGAGKGPNSGAGKGQANGKGKGKNPGPLPLPAPPKKLSIEDATEDQKMIMFRDKAKKGVAVLEACIVDLKCMEQDYKNAAFYCKSKALKDKVVDMRT